MRRAGPEQWQGLIPHAYMSETPNHPIPGFQAAFFYRRIEIE